MSEKKIYGLIGKNLQHSFSPAYFEAKFKREKIKNAAYQLFPLNNASDIHQLLQSNELHGLNVTIPFKEDILVCLNALSPVASAVGAVNCIKISAGKLIGHNTDVIGFEKSLIPLLMPHHTKALVLGTGGASKAVAFVLNKLNIEFKFVSTKDAKPFLTYEEATIGLQDFPLIINTTPVGLFPKIEHTPLKSFDGVSPQHLFYDLIYNPEKTKFLEKAAKRGASIKNGLEMLEIQAAESWLIWNAESA